MPGRSPATDRSASAAVASIAQQALQAELVDELQIHIAPVILGAGRPLFGELATRLQLQRTRVLDSPFAMHIKFRVLK